MNGPCSGKWSKSEIHAVELSRFKVKSCAGAAKWARAHDLPTPINCELRGNGRYFRLTLDNPDKYLCFRYGKWVDGGRVRFVFGGNVKGIRRLPRARDAYGNLLKQGAARRRATA